MKNKNKIIVLIALIAAIFSFGAYILNFYFFEYTNKAEIIINKIDILSKINGKISELNIEENAEVNKGEILVQFESKEYTDKIDEMEKKLENIQDTTATSKNNSASIKLKSAKQEEKNAKLKLEEANNDYVRYKNAYKDGSVTKKDLDRAVENLETARNKYILAQNNLKTEEKKYNSLINSKNEEINKLTTELDELRQKLQETTIIAPVSGTIKNVNIQSGKEIEAESKLFTIVENDAFINAEFSEKQISRINSGQKAKIKIGNKLLDGTVKSKENSTAKINIIPDDFDLDNSSIKVKIKVK